MGGGIAVANLLADRLPVQGLVRRAVRAPIWLYRAHLGRLLGHQMLLLTHRGRKTGLPRQTVLEVLHYDRASGTHVVAAGWGEQSDWFRNVLQTPAVEVAAGGHEAAAQAIRLSPAAAERELRYYTRRHPLRARAFSRLMTGQPFRGSDADVQRMARAVPLVALRPTAR